MNYDMLAATNSRLRPRSQSVTMRSITTPKSGAPTTTCLTQTDGSSRSMPKEPGTSCTLALAGASALARR